MPSSDFDLGTTTEDTKLKAKVIIGEDPCDTTGKTKVTDEIVTVKQLLGPLAQGVVDILRCVGLNYAKHSKPIRSSKTNHEYAYLSPNHGQRNWQKSAAIPIHIL